MTLVASLLMTLARAQTDGVPSVCGRLTTCGTWTGRSSQNWSDHESKTFATTLRIIEPSPGIVHLTETTVGEETTVWTLELTFAAGATFTARQLTDGRAGDPVGAGRCLPQDCWFTFAPPYARGGLSFAFANANQATLRIDQRLPSGRAFTRMGVLTKAK